LTNGNVIIALPSGGPKHQKNFHFHARKRLTRLNQKYRISLAELLYCSVITQTREASWLRKKSYEFIPEMEKNSDTLCTRQLAGARPVRKYANAMLCGGPMAESPSLAPVE